MAGAKEIRTKIKSIQSTQKITRAMEMVAASKMRNAQNRMRSARPFTDKIRKVIGHLALANPEHVHPFMETRDVKRVGLVVVSSDRGLCGGLNVNLFKAVTAEMKRCQDAGIQVDVSVIGSKGTSFFKRVGGNVVAQVDGLGDTPHLSDVLGNVKVLLDAYRNGTIDKLVLVSNEFVNTMTQKPTVEVVLPLQASEDADQKHSWDYIYEPNAMSVLDQLLTRYVESVIYQGVVENVACEMAARMIAMKAATDNAGDLIHELQLVYNKARQAAITQEISEIVGGAAAVS